MKIWIDATSPQSELRVFGMSLLERHLRAILQIGLQPTEVCVELAPESVRPPELPAELARRLPLRWGDGSREEGATGNDGAREEDVVLALEGDAVVDARLLRAMVDQPGPAAFVGGEGRERTAVLRLSAMPRGGPRGGVPLADFAEGEIANGALAEVRADAVSGYIATLRRTLPLYVFKVTDGEARDRAERFLFWSNYKGSTDFFTKYVYPPLVWRATRWLARKRVHPNVVTVFNVIITIAAVPLFARGEWLLGLILAYTMSVLDSVDGKLARLTFSDSTLGNVLDHGTDLIHPPVWYFSWAYALGGARVDTPIFGAAVWLALFYVLDRIVVRLFKHRVGIVLHAQSLLDAQLRTIISRRNINVPVFTVGLLIGLPGVAFQLIVFWQVATLAYHSVRLLQCWGDGDKTKTPAT